MEKGRDSTRLGDRRQRGEDSVIHIYRRYEELKVVWAGATRRREGPCIWLNSALTALKFLLIYLYLCGVTSDGTVERVCEDRRSWQPHVHYSSSSPHFHVPFWMLPEHRS